MTIQKQAIYKTWVMKVPIPEAIKAELSKYHPILQQLLYSRGCVTNNAAEHFIEGIPTYDTNPFRLSAMEETIDRVIFAIEKGEKIAIYGDYDVDGVTGTALLNTALSALNANVVSYIPNRFDQGYGLNIQALDDLREESVSLVITVDNGIRSIKEAAYAHEHNMDLIITDHHQPLDELPFAQAIVNPKKANDTYPFKDLASVGLAFKVVHALNIHFIKQNITKPFKDGFLEGLFDFVALGTVADVVPLIEENRYFVKKGLQQLNQTQRRGVNTLIDVAKLHKGNITSTDIGFGLAPRLNAAGRIATPLTALKLLMTEDSDIAVALAQQLNTQNSERRDKTRSIQHQAEGMIFIEDNDPAVLFAFNEGFSSGVVGLVASKLVDMYYRPAIIGEEQGDFVRASCRSIPEFHITKALDECADLLIRHGGHAAAAGFTIHNHNIPELKERLGFIAKRELSIIDLSPKILIDCEIDLININPKELFDIVTLLEPTGSKNHEAVFLSRNVTIKEFRRVGDERQHLLLKLRCGLGIIDAIGFSLAAVIERDILSCDIVFSIGINHFNGRTTFQLFIKDIKPSKEQQAAMPFLQ